MRRCARRTASTASRPSLGDTWHDSIVPELRKKLQPEDFRAVDSVLTQILESPRPGSAGPPQSSGRGATGSLFAFLVLMAYVLWVSAVFLIGVEIDEAVRNGRAPTRRTRGGRSGRAKSSSSR